MSSYRSAALCCPRCDAFMQEHEASTVVVERCPRCSGLWVDWFDGDLATVASDAGRIPRGVPSHESGTGKCPRCRVRLVETRYRKDGPMVLRCGECAGAFIPRDELDVLVAMGPPVQLREHEPMFAWTQLIESLRRWLGG